MPQSIHTQMEIWLEIAILQKYATVNEYRFPIGDDNRNLMRPCQIREKLDKLIKKTCRKFNLAPPDQDCHPRNKMFKDWHHEMLVYFCCINYSKMLCSFCPLSLGMEVMIEKDGATPCILLKDTKLFSFDPQGCIILTSEYWNEAFLIQHILAHHGSEMTSSFLSIRSAFNM